MKVPKVRWREIEIAKLKPHGQNVKIHPQSQIEKIKSLILKVGFKNPIVIDKEGTIWAGHGAIEAAKQLGLKRVPFVDISRLSEEEKRAYMIADNQANESDWNVQNVRALISDVPLQIIEEYGVNIKTIDNGYILPLAEQILEQKEFSEEPLAQVKTTRIKTGDLYQLGRHRLLCGDCRDPANVERLFEGKTADQLLTDPPYGVDYSEKNKFLNSIAFANRIEKPIENDSITNYREFFASFLRIIPFSDYNTVYIFLAGKHTLDLELACEDAGITWTTWLIWLKNNHVLGRMDYAPIHEPILYGWKNKHKFYGPFRTSVMSYDKPQSSDKHPTMKPVPLLSQLMQDGTEPNMVVYDPFLGSGSTLIAAEHSNRICYGIEIDPLYCQTIIDRWEKYAKQKAVKIA